MSSTHSCSTSDILKSNRYTSHTHTHTITHSPHSPTHSPTHSLTHSLPHSHTHALTHTHTHKRTVQVYKWKNHFYEMKGDVGMSGHEKEREQDDAYTKTESHS